jgi:hydantoinase/carbamoylase family amidase
MTGLSVDPAAVIADLDELAQLSGGRFAGAKRLAWTDDWLAARRWLSEKLEALGLEPHTDGAGNLSADLPGESNRFILLGSHIDAVPDGGWLDGALGVLTALEVVRQITRTARTPAIGIRFVDWADEEGARFGRSLIGSSAAAGTLSAAEVSGLTDRDGVSLADALARCGVDLETAASAPSDVLAGVVAYLELHIEQGPVLRDGGILVAPVSGIVGVERHLITFTGQAAHAGSTPIALRQDSLAAAARAALAIRESAITHGGVATVGAMRSTPGIITAVAGVTEMQLDQRHLDADQLAAMLADARRSCADAAAEFGCAIEIRSVLSAAPTLFDPALVDLVRSTIDGLSGRDVEPIPSGPLHDATEIGRVVPTAMIFAQSDPPISHAAIEDSPEEALSAAIDAYGRMVERLLSPDMLTMTA